MVRPASAAMKIAAIFVLLFLILPTFVIIPMSFSPTETYQFPPSSFSLRWYERFFTDPQWTASLYRSLRIGCAAAFLAVVLGVFAAFSLFRGKFFGRKIVLGLLMSPLIVPHVILAAGLYVFYANIGMLQTETGLIIAHTVLGMPIVIVTVTASLKTIRHDLELASMSLGAGYVTTFVKVTLPQVLPGILTGALFAFVSSFDEATVALFITDVRTITLPVKMWESISVESNPVLPAASAIILVISTLPIVMIEVFRRWRASRRYV